MVCFIANVPAGIVVGLHMISAAVIVMIDVGVTVIVIVIIMPDGCSPAVVMGSGVACAEGFASLRALFSSQSSANLVWALHQVQLLQI